jgi:hypothetical protein
MHNDDDTVNDEEIDVDAENDWDLESTVENYL